MVNINQQIAEVEQRRRDAQEAERQRIADQTANQRTIEAANQELAKLHAAEAKAREKDLRAALQDAATLQSSPAVQTLFKQLNEIGTQTLGSLSWEAIAAPVQQARDRAEMLAASIYEQIAAQEWERGKERLAEYEATYGAAGGVKNDQMTQQVIGSRLGGLVVGLAAIDVLALWINQAGSPAERTFRHRMGFLLTGLMIDPPDNFTPSTAFQVFRR